MLIYLGQQVVKVLLSLKKFLSDQQTISLT